MGASRGLLVWVCLILPIRHFTSLGSSTQVESCETVQVTTSYIFNIRPQSGVISKPDQDAPNSTAGPDMKTTVFNNNRPVPGADQCSTTTDLSLVLISGKQETDLSLVLISGKQETDLSLVLISVQQQTDLSLVLISIQQQTDLSLCSTTTDLSLVLISIQQQTDPSLVLISIQQQTDLSLGLISIQQQTDLSLVLIMFNNNRPVPSADQYSTTNRPCIMVEHKDHSYTHLAKVAGDIKEQLSAAQTDQTVLISCLTTTDLSLVLISIQQQTDLYLVQISIQQQTDLYLYSTTNRPVPGADQDSTTDLSLVLISIQQQTGLSLRLISIQQQTDLSLVLISIQQTDLSLRLIMFNNNRPVPGADQYSTTNRPFPGADQYSTTNRPVPGADQCSTTTDLSLVLISIQQQTDLSLVLISIQQQTDLSLGLISIQQQTDLSLGLISIQQQTDLSLCSTTTDLSLVLISIQQQTDLSLVLISIQQQTDLSLGLISIQQQTDLSLGLISVQQQQTCPCPTAIRIPNHRQIRPADREKQLLTEMFRTIVKPPRGRISPSPEAVWEIPMGQTILPGCVGNPDGSDYRGDVAVTISGKTCQRWDAEKTHQHTLWLELFPELTENYCRNPSPESKYSVWCYTTDPSTLWEYCINPACPMGKRDCVHSVTHARSQGGSEEPPQGSEEPRAEALEVPSSSCLQAQVKDRVKCGDENMTKLKCEEKGCCYDTSDFDAPWCFFGTDK
ncbi:hypothetical protein Bbelb_071350 [Branchiostoma belcheri]|nr:hypothetical protein Bbelb_071350 [Branchiostoma belcheri]